MAGAPSAPRTFFRACDSDDECRIARTDVEIAVCEGPPTGERPIWATFEPARVFLRLPVPPSPTLCSAGLAFQVE